MPISMGEVISKLVMAIGILSIANMMAWVQMNAQFTERLKNHWFWSSGEWMALFGIPIGYMFFHATRLSYEHFGFTWNIRMIGFGLGTLIFGIMSYLFLREIPTMKTIICLLLALSIILIQLTNVIGE